MWKFTKTTPTWRKPLLMFACSTMTNQRKKVSPCPCLDAHPVRFYRNYRRESGGCEERQRRWLSSTPWGQCACFGNIPVKMHKHSQIQLHKECGVRQKDIIPNKRRSLPTNTGVGKTKEQLVQNKLSFTPGAGQCGAMLRP